MTPYAKAWVFTIAMALCLSGLLLALAIAFLGDLKVGVIVGMIAMTAHFAWGYSALYWPKCPSCKEPFNAPDTGKRGFFTPTLPPRTCGYCGHPLT